MCLLEPTWSCISPPECLPRPLQVPPSLSVSGLMDPGESPQPFWIRQNKESGSCGFSLINSKPGVFEGWGGKEVKWDIWDHGSLQEDWKESCKGFRTAWSEREPEVPSWQFSKLVRILLFSNRRKIRDFCCFLPLLLEWLPWKKKSYCCFCNSQKTTKQYLLFFWSDTKTANETMPDCPLSARDWDLCLPPK